MYSEHYANPQVIIVSEDEINGGVFLTIDGELATSSDVPVFYYPISSGKAVKGQSVVAYGFGSIVRVKNANETATINAGSLVAVGSGGVKTAETGDYLVAKVLEELKAGEYGFAILLSGETKA